MKTRKEPAMMKHEFSSKLRHEIQDPLAALRSALYLISVRTDDFQILEYVKLAEKEALEIASTLTRPMEIRKRAA
jgi:nitrogen-specific signal transduction histidine kinase